LNGRLGKMKTGIGHDSFVLADDVPVVMLGGFGVGKRKVNYLIRVIFYGNMEHLV
jgi:hypothetical protein